MGRFSHIQLYLGTFFLLLLLETTVSYPRIELYSTPDNPDITYTYSRFPEIEKHCGLFISSATELPPDDNRGERIKKELFFVNGDWDQVSGESPLMPFDDPELPSNTYGDGPPLKLVSFWLKHVDPIRRAKNAVSVSGVMEIGRVRTGSFSYKPYDWSPKFYMERGNSRLSIIFEGIYLESQENGGQLLMCLLGTATIPSYASRNRHAYDHGEPLSPRQPQEQPSTLQDDQILLVLRFPKTFGLTSRGISGEMKSLNHRRCQTYFDEVLISSQLSQISKYQFGSEEILPNACNTYPDSLLNEDVQIFKGDDYCEKLRGLVWNEVFDFVSPWKNAVRSNNHSKIGPFSLDTTYSSSDELRLMFQELECGPGTEQNGIQEAMVSAVLRVLQSRYLSREEMRTGLSTFTLSAEGRWRSSDGQLCMIGCVGPPAALSQGCRSRITLYFPHTMSIKQRSILLGTISSINTPELHVPLMFQKLTTLNDFLRGNYWIRDLKWSYKYSKITQAREFQRRSQPSNLGIMLRKSVFQYPSSMDEDIASFSFFADVLSVEVCAAPQTLTDSQAPKTHVEMVLLSMGSLLGRYKSSSHTEKQESLEAFYSISEEIEISGHLKINGGQLYNISLFFEGIYDPEVGQMHLIGCRDVKEFEEFSNDDRNLEGGLDCLIEIKVEYSPKNARWLLNPNIKFSIYSQRSKEDPFYLTPLRTNTFLLSYQKKFLHVLIRKGFEVGLSMVLLAMAILCMRGQLRYTENQGHPTAYISLVMLGTHALGFTLTLISGDGALLKWKEFTPYRNSAYDFNKFQFLQAFELCIKFLLLFAVLESTKLMQRVFESRKMLKAHVKQLNFRIPSDKLVFAFFFLIHVVGFSTLFTVRKISGIPLLLRSESYGLGGVNEQRMLKWWREMENYGGLLQDFFLLPQIIGNTLWGVQGEPLRKLYYIGFTVIRLVLQVYDYASDPVPNQNHSDLEFQYLGVESYYNLGNIIVSVIIVTLALAVYIQQSLRFWNIRPTKKMDDCDNLEAKPGYLYDRLLSE